MKNLFFIFALLLSTVVSPGCSSTRGAKAGAKVHKDRIAKEILAIINATDPHVSVGIKISPLHDDEVVFEKNAKRHFMPASTTKLLTLAAALHYLGPSYRFTTTLLTDGFVKGEGAIKNLYLKGSGDPSLMDHHLAALASELKQMGIKTITGHIYFDDQIFDEILWNPGVSWEDRQRGFGAPTSGLNLNYNRIVLKTVPSHAAQKLASVIVEPLSSFVEVITKAKTVNNGGQKLTMTVVRDQHREKDWPSTTNDGVRQGDRIYVEGQIAKGFGPQYQLIAVNDPAALAGVFLKDQLLHRGIRVDKAVLRKPTPASATVLTSYESRSLAEALIDFTKISNNIANDALVKAIAARGGARPATSTAGLALINDFLVKEVGFEPNSLRTADGAGLSRYNLITPEQMVKLLKYAAHRFHMAPEFMAALPIVGEDGNLSHRRLAAEHLRGNVRAKSGTLSGVSSLVGYLTASDGNPYAFAIMADGIPGSVTKYHRMQDQILTALLLGDQEAQVAATK